LARTAINGNLKEPIPFHGFISKFVSFSLSWRISYFPLHFGDCDQALYFYFLKVFFNIFFFVQVMATVCCTPRHDYQASVAQHKDSVSVAVSV
jgi:hypothetical protein